MNPLRIFIVDDDSDLAEILAMALEGRGHIVDIAGSGEEAIEKFRTNDYDIAFMDVQLPGRNGVESFLEIRKIKPDAKVVMMTGYSVEQLLQQAQQNGAWGIFHKPFDVQKMFDIIEKIRKKGILIADDDPAFVSALTHTLERHGYLVHTANNGQAALEFVRNNGVDVLILDLRLPVMSGLEVVIELRKEGTEIPTVIVTAFGIEDDERLQKLASMPVSGIVQKPFDVDKFLTELDQIAY